MPLYLTNQLKRAIQNDPSRCVLFVGAGLSATGVRKGGMGLPDWDTLMQRMIEDLRNSQNCDDDTLANLEQSLKEGRYLEIAGKFKKRTRPDQFAEFLKAELDPPDLAPSEIHKVILKTNFRGIITTNFDCVFEYHNHQLRPLVYPNYLENTYDFQRYGFFAKIHGCIRNTPNLAENLIITEESYNALRSNTKYQFILHSIFFMHTVLTVGFSLRDPDFLRLIGDLGEIFGDNTPTVYALMLDPGQEKRDRWRAKGIEIMPYDNHGELLGFFEKMLELSGQLHPLPIMTLGQLEQAKAPHKIRPIYSKYMAKTIAFLSIDQLVARAAIEAKKAELEAGGAKTVIINYFAQDTTDFMAYLTKIKYVNPDLLITCLPGKVEQIIQKQILELDGWGAIQILRLDYTAITPMPTTIVKPLPAPPKPAGWQELPKNLKDIYNINYYVPGKWITMTTQPMPTIILALDPTFFPNSELREYDVPAGTTNAQYRDIIINKYPSEKGGEYDNFQVLEKGDITLDDGTQTIYMIYSASRMGYTMQAIAVFLVKGTQGFILTGGDYPATFSDSLPLLTQIVKTLHSTIMLSTPAPTPTTQQMPPCRVQGTATLDGKAAADGTTVTALIDGRQVAQGTVTSGQFKVQFDATNYIGKTITFKVGTANARETAITAYGLIPQNLTATSGVVTPAPTPTTTAPPAPPKPAGWQALPQDIRYTYKIDYYFPGEWITMTSQPLPTIILALDPTFFPNSELREYDVPAGTTNAQYRDIIINKYPSEKGGEYDNFQVLEKGDITLDDGTQTVYMIYSASRMGYTMQAIAVFLVKGIQGFILTGGDYPATFSDSLPLLTQIVKTLHSTIPLPPTAPQNWNKVWRKR